MLRRNQQAALGGFTDCCSSSAECGHGDILTWPPNTRQLLSSPVKVRVRKYLDTSLELNLNDALGPDCVQKLGVPKEPEKKKSFGDQVDSKEVLRN